MNSEKEKPLQGVAETSNLILYSKEKSILKSFDKVQAQTDDRTKINQILENNSIPQTSGIFSNPTIDNCSEIFLEPASEDSEDELSETDSSQVSNTSPGAFLPDTALTTTKFSNNEPFSPCSVDSSPASSAESAGAAETVKWSGTALDSCDTTQADQPPLEPPAKLGQVRANSLRSVRKARKKLCDNGGPAAKRVRGSGEGARAGPHGPRALLSRWYSGADNVAPQQN